MAVVRNKTGDARSLGLNAPAVRAGDHVEVPDDLFVGRAWPRSTWELAKKPKGFVDACTGDAYLYLPAAAGDTPASDTEEKE